MTAVSPNRFAIPIITIACLLLLPGCSRITASKTPPNVIVIVMDTLRADHMGCYGYPRNTTPALDRLSQSGTMFSHCISPAPRTNQAVASLLTGKYPVNHGVRSVVSRLPFDETTLAEALHAQGYRTVGVMGNGIMHDRQFSQGFDIFRDTDTHFTAWETTRLALETVRDLESPYFLWVHYWGPHMEYNPSRLYFNRHYTGRFRDRLHHHPDKCSIAYENDMSPEEREHAVALYDSVIRENDREIERLIRTILSESDTPLIYFLSDHGESFGRSDYHFDHGELLDQAAVRVPLILTGHDLTDGVYPGLVRIMDIMPTALKACGVDFPHQTIDGIDLQRTVRHNDHSLTVYCESGKVLCEEAYTAGFRDPGLPDIEGRRRALISGNLKMECHPYDTGAVYYVYDLESDPAESVNCINRLNEDILVDMQTEILNWIHQDIARQDYLDRDGLTENEIVRLQALGYL